MVRNVKLVIAYDGTEFHGWQKQPELRTVQGVVEQAIRRTARHQAELIGSGRTDAGVHAAGQVANFRTECAIPAFKLRAAIGSRLPKDVSLTEATDVATEFDARISAHSKLYRYRIHNAADRPVGRLAQRQTYHFWNPLDVERMRQAASHFIGMQDFAAMASKGSERETTVRTVLRCEVERWYDEVRVSVIGCGFLYNQVRNMVGTLIEVGRGHWEPDYVGEIMAGKDRRAAGPTAPARGLSLQWVRYPAESLRPDYDPPTIRK
jgi:tRNA pseudouridine38-40 synthase